MRSTIVPKVHRPPLTDRGDGERGRVVVAAHAHPRFIPRHVVDATRNRFADRVPREIVDAHRFGGAGRLPFAARILEIPNQFLLLRVDRDHGLPATEQRRGGRADVLELRVPIRMRRALLGLLDHVRDLMAS